MLFDNSAYFLRKLCYMSVSFFMIVTLTFFLMKCLPGDPFSDEQALPKEIYDSLLKHYGLDRPWYIQYKEYLLSISSGNLGPSFKHKDLTVNEIIRNGFPVSALLGLEATCLALGVGISLGALAALKANRWIDHLILLMTSTGVSVPSFILAAFLQYLLAVKWQIFPLARWGSFSHTILPATALAALPTAFIARLTRTTLIEIWQSDYIKAAKAKGLSIWQVLIFHGLRNSLLPVISYLGQLVANILVGSFVIEKIFSIPGLGQWFVNSVNNRDYTVLMGLTIFYSLILMITMLVMDIAYVYIDPRIKLQKGS